jgi:hypothetical protein
MSLVKHRGISVCNGNERAERDSYIGIKPSGSSLNVVTYVTDCMVEIPVEARARTFHRRVPTGPSLLYSGYWALYLLRGAGIGRALQLTPSPFSSKR